MRDTTLEAFLANLDGGNKRGSFDWRYFPIEESSNETVPVVSISIMQEIVYGCLRIIEHMSHSDRDPLHYTHSWRLRWLRREPRQQNLWASSGSGRFPSA